MPDKLWLIRHAETGASVPVADRRLPLLPASPLAANGMCCPDESAAECLHARLAGLPGFGDPPKAGP
jgi:hypothetical protein